MIFTIKEYNQEPETENNPYPDTYTDNVFPVFENLDEVYKYAKEHDIYGVAFGYDKEEYNYFKNSNSHDSELPDILEAYDL